MMIPFRSVVALVALAIAPVPLMAGSLFGLDKKQVPQWALDANKTPTPEYAKNSSAVVLYDEYVETVDNSGRAVERERKAVRILKPQGREDAYCAVIYDVDQKVNYFRAWTITADGKQYQAQDTDFFLEGDLTGDSILLSTAQVKAVRAPAADVGATVVCESEELQPPYVKEDVWQIQRDIPFVFEALEVDLPTGMPHVDAWHNHVAVKSVEVGPNHLRWELKDVHALNLRDVSSRPNAEALYAHMSVHWGDVAVEGKENQWRAIGQWMSNLEEHRSDPSPEIVAKAQELAANAPDFYSKLKEITSYIQKNIRYFIVVRGIGGLQAHPAADIFRNRYGDCKDKATIVISMLQAVGIHADYVAVDTHRGVVDPEVPSSEGNHMISAIEIPAGVKDARLHEVLTAKNGKRYLIFDPTDERTPVGNMRSELQGSYGLLIAGAESQVFEIPVLAPETNGSERVGRFQLASDGTLSGDVVIRHTGPTGAFWRYLIKYTDKKERTSEVEKYLTGDLPGVTLDNIQFKEPADLDQPLELQFKVTVPSYAHSAGPLLLVRSRVVGDHTHAFDNKPRKLPIELGEIGHWHDNFEIKIPDGWAVDDLPDPINVDMDFASYHSTVTSKGNLLRYERDYKMSKVELPADRAAEFRRLESEILTDQKSTVVLKKQ